MESAKNCIFHAKQAESNSVPFPLCASHLFYLGFSSRSAFTPITANWMSFKAFFIAQAYQIRLNVHFEYELHIVNCVSRLLHCAVSIVPRISWNRNSTQNWESVFPYILLNECSHSEYGKHVIFRQAYAPITIDFSRACSFSRPTMTIDQHTYFMWSKHQIFISVVCIVINAHPAPSPACGRNRARRLQNIVWNAVLAIFIEMLNQDAWLNLIINFAWNWY